MTSGLSHLHGHFLPRLDRLKKTTTDLHKPPFQFWNTVIYVWPCITRQWRINDELKTASGIFNS